MERKCLCCGRAIVGNECKYDGFFNVVLLDESGLSKEKERAEAHRTKIVDGIKEISFSAYKYSGCEMKGRVKVVIADGTRCYKKLVWSKESFAQNTDESEKIRSLEIGYTVNGVAKTVSVDLELVRCSDFWKLGVEIQEDLSLAVYLGTADRHTKSKAYDLEFV